MPEAARRLLDHIVRNRLLPIEERQIEMDATAVDTDTLPEEIQGEMERERLNAELYEDAFEAALARAARQPEQPLTLDDRVPEENRMAEALIRFLVKSELASVVSEPVGPQHYRYDIAIDWAALDIEAFQAGVSLKEAVSS